MAFLFNKKKTPAEAVRSMQKYLTLVEENKVQDADAIKKTSAKLIENCETIKFWLIGDSENEPKKETADKMVECLLEGKVLLQILHNLQIFEFESRKDLSAIFLQLCRNYKDQIIAYVISHQNLITLLVDGYTDSSIALTCGTMLRELIRFEELCQLILQPTHTTMQGQSANATSILTPQPPQENGQLPSPHLDRFFGFVQLPVFDTASDAFSTLKLLLTKHKKLIAKFLDGNFHDFFTKYTQLLLLSDSYVTKRLGLKLLAELLLARENFNIMMKFINISDYLKIIMSMLRGTTKAIQIEAFHVFKIFVANPRKSDQIISILYRNREKLVEFLNNFNKEKADEQFIEEKSILLSTLINLEPPNGM